MFIRRNVPTRQNWSFGLVVISLMVAGGIGALLFYAIPAHSNAKALVDHGRPTQAQVYAVYDRSGRRERRGRYAIYRFTVEGREYEGKTDTTEGYGFRGPIKVFYLPEDPSVSAGAPADELSRCRRDLVFVVVWIVFVSGVGAFVLRMKRD
jgi:hypothetical protein